MRPRPRPGETAQPRGSSVRGPQGPLRAPATGLPDRVVLEIITRVIAERGYFDLGLALVWICAERQARANLLHFPLRHVRESCPSGAA